MHKHSGSFVFISSILFILLSCAHERPTHRQYTGVIRGEVIGAGRNMQLREQGPTEWCWIVSIAMLADHYGNRFRLCDMATKNTAYANDCCMTLGDQCNSGGTNRQIDAMCAASGLSCLYQNRRLTEWELQAELLERPIGISFRTRDTKPSREHMAVIAGFIPRKADVLDPPLYLVLNPAMDAPLLRSYEELTRWTWDDGTVWEWAESWTQVVPF